jgi:predicted DNA-binding protein (MmcQ/YjbR family)
MSIEWIRAHCLALPHTTEQVQWGDDLVFKIAGKMYAMTPLVPHSVKLSFKCTPEEFAELIERPGIIPAPYLARAQWVALETLDALPRAEAKRLLTRSYELVWAKLSKKAQTELAKPVKEGQKRVRPSVAGAGTRGRT